MSKSAGIGDSRAHHPACGRGSSCVSAEAGPPVTIRCNEPAGHSPDVVWYATSFLESGDQAMRPDGIVIAFRAVEAERRWRGRIVRVGGPQEHIEVLDDGFPLAVERAAHLRFGRRLAARTTATAAGATTALALRRRLGLGAEGHIRSGPRPRPPSCPPPSCGEGGRYSKPSTGSPPTISGAASGSSTAVKGALTGAAGLRRRDHHGRRPGLGNQPFFGTFVVGECALPQIIIESKPDGTLLVDEFE